MKRLISMVLLMCLVTIGCASNSVSGNSVQSAADYAEQTTSTPSNDTFTINFKYLDGAWSNLDLTGGDFTNQAEYEALVNKYISEITALYKLNNWYSKYGDNLTSCTLQTKFTALMQQEILGSTQFPSTDGSHGITSTIQVDKYAVKNGLDVMTHELTHLMLGNSFSFSLNEGVACYANRNITGRTTTGWKVANVDDCLKNYMEPFLNESLGNTEFTTMKDNVLSYIGVNLQSYPFGTSGQASALFFMYSESFVQYLINTYGTENFIKFYNTAKGIDDYTMLDSKGFESIKVDWLQHYDNYVPTESRESIESKSTEFSNIFKKIHQMESGQ